jgi:glycosyltransferase involved in cell wall biosynthesis
MKNNKLSVLIITLNEEDNIAGALGSVADIASEIIVVDSGSTDKTLDIAKRYGAKIYHREFDNYANQKNFARNKAANDWVLSLDADETISRNLGEEIIKAISSNDYEAYSMPRRNKMLGEFINHSRWQPELDRHVWLFKKEKGKWVGDVHEEVEVSGSVGKLKNPKLHFSHETISEFMKMMNSYSELDAKNRNANGIDFSFFRLILDPVYNFIVRFFYRKGYLDGWRGFVLSYLMAIYHLELWIKIWSKQNKKND